MDHADKDIDRFLAELLQRLDDMGYGCRVQLIDIADVETDNRQILQEF